MFKSRAAPLNEQVEGACARSKSFSLNIQLRGTEESALVAAPVIAPPRCV